MPNTTDDLTDEQQQAQAHPPAWSTVFGDEDLSAYTPQDQPAPPGPRSTARAMAGKVKQGEAEARHEQNMDHLQVQAQRDAAEAAHEEVMRRIARGQDISPRLAEQAMRHQRQQGGLGSTATRLARPALARRKRERAAAGNRPSGRG